MSRHASRSVRFGLALSLGLGGGGAIFVACGTSSSVTIASSTDAAASDASLSDAQNSVDADVLDATRDATSDGALDATTTFGGSAIPAPASGAFLGAWINPAADAGAEEGQTESFEKSIGRPLALHMHYSAWTEGGDAGASFPTAEMIDDQTAKRIPVVSWSCSGLFSEVANAAASSTAGSTAAKDYQVILNTAHAIKAFGSPIFLRWAWEMNEGANASCQDSANPQASFIAAWQNIYTIFQAQGVTNVAWLWNPGGEGVNATSAMGYYPGSAYVDWIGFDGYDRTNALDFGKIFSVFYEDFATNFSTHFPGNAGRPLLVGETGECQGTNAKGTDLQMLYLDSARLEMEGKVEAGTTSFPMLKGFMYFDAQGPYTGCDGGVNWPLSPAGISAFGVMGSETYFAP